MHTSHTYGTLCHPFLHMYVGNTVPFLHTPTSLLPEHSVLTDVQQAAGRNGQQWITCRSGGQGTRPKIFLGNDERVLSGSSANSATIGLGTQHPNGLYHCFLGKSVTEYFSLFLQNSGKHVHMTFTSKTCCHNACNVLGYKMYDDVPSSSHSINTHCKCPGLFNVDNCITRWQQSGEIYCRV